MYLVVLLTASSLYFLLLLLLFFFFFFCLLTNRNHQVAGDGKEDAAVDFKEHENKIRKVVHAHFQRLHPRRKMGPPKVTLRFIPAANAHIYKIDGLVW